MEGLRPEPGLGSDGKALQLLGLARRAGRAVVGTEAVREAGRRGELDLALIARDASANARRRMRGLLADPAVEVVWCGSRESLGRAVGRTGVAVVGVSDRGLARQIAAAACRGVKPDPPAGRPPADER